MTRIGLLLTALLLGGLAWAQPRELRSLEPSDEPEEVLTGPELMRRVRASLPPMPLRLTGLIRTRRDGDDTDRRLESELRFGDPEPHSIYRLWNAFGDLITTVKVKWTRNGPEFLQWNGAGEPMPPPAPLDEVADTGLTWSDLSLSFLWWPNATITGSARVKARPAFTVSLPAPDSRPDVHEVLLWVDKKALFIVKAELRDAEGTLLKRIEVDSIKEVREDLWMVKDILIRDKEHGIRMGVRFETVEEIGAEDE